MPVVMSSQRPGPRVLCLGRTYCDLVFTGLSGLPILGRELFAENVAIVPGGGAFITAAHLVSLGSPTALVTRLGTDPLSKGLEKPIEASGVDMSFLEKAEDAGPQLTVAIVQPQDRAFLSRRAGHARPAPLKDALSTPGIRHLHIAEYATLAEFPDLVAEAKSRGVSVSLDPSWDETLIHDPAFLANCRGIDLFLPNMEEAAAIARSDDEDKVLDLLSDHFPLVVLKKGQGGAVLISGNERHSRPAPQVQVVDTTGAGDAFNAGFLHHWLLGEDRCECLEAAINVGSQSVQAVGGASALDWSTASR